jgi:oligopeptide transport system ATP-binding protein
MSHGEVILSVKDLKVHFPVHGKGLFGRSRALKAVDGVSFDVHAGETLGIVGESGSGKSTVGRAVLQLIKSTSGRIVWLGKDIAGISRAQMKPRRREMQIVFQDPLASLNPRMTAGDIIAEPLMTFEPELSAEDRKARVREIMSKVGLLPQMINRYPHEFSGGQNQRIGIARAMILKPKLIVADEPVSSLDVSIRAQIINLLADLQHDTGVAFIFISHDLAVVRHVSHRVLVLYLGKVMELADGADLLGHPRHPYTQALLSAAPVPDPEIEAGKKRIVLEGDLPSPINPPKCAEEVPALETRGGQNGHVVACHFPS